MASGRFFDTGYFTRMHLVTSVLLIQQNRDPVGPFSNIRNFSSSYRLHDDLCAIWPLWRPPHHSRPGLQNLPLPFDSSSCPGAEATLPRITRRGARRLGLRPFRGWRGRRHAVGHRFAQTPAVRPEGPSLSGQTAPVLWTLVRGIYRQGAGYRF